MSHILLLHGPNLNLQGRREPSVYGQETLADLVQQARQTAEQVGARLSDFQSNHEGQLIDAIHRSLDQDCLLYTSPSPRDRQKSRMPSSA